MLEWHIPSLDEMEFRQNLLADPQTMSYNARWGGTVDFPKERWQDWYRRWVSDATDGRFYAYLYSPQEKAFVGEAACHLDTDTNRWIADVIVHSRYRGRGYGRQGLQLLCEHCRSTGIKTLYDSIAADNPSVALFLKSGFEAVEATEEVIWVKKDL